MPPHSPTSPHTHSVRLGAVCVALGLLVALLSLPQQVAAQDTNAAPIAEGTTPSDAPETAQPDDAPDATPPAPHDVAEGPIEDGEGPIEDDEGPIEDGEGPVEDDGLAQDDTLREGPSGDKTPEAGDTAPTNPDDNIIETTTDPFQLPGRANSRVTREQLEARMPRSTPDALRYEPGVYVQQTAHSQGSPFVRGRTGQQTVLLFDHVRMNNSLFRQGPNQYFFTIDSRTIDHIDVLRGSASTRYGSDAIAGVLHAFPQEPTFVRGEEGFRVTPKAFARHATADGELGGRLQLDTQYGEHIGLIGGFGYRDVGMLQSGGPIFNPRNGELPEVPRFDEDGRTQLGTGFEEYSGDARLVIPLSKDLRVITAFYDYRQRDAPRTDQCAPAYAPFDECLSYEEQDRTVVYSALEGDLGAAARDMRLTLSFQRQHERRKYERPSSFTVNGGRDDVNTFGAAMSAITKAVPLSETLNARLRYGADAYHDQVESVAWLIFTDFDIVRNRSRGQYMDGSTYTWGGAFAEGELMVFDQLIFRAGGRLAHAAASAPSDEESGTLPVDQSWSDVVGGAGVEWLPNETFALTFSADQGFRAPNLDDLTSRQRTGPGFQFENANLEPERAVTWEVGTAVTTKHIELHAWGYYSTLDGGIARAPRNTAECPPNTLACENTWSRFQLINLPGEAVIYGYEGSILAYGPWGFQARATLAWAFGEGPNPQPRSDIPTGEPYEERVPLTRIPPLNGTAELMWRSHKGVYFGAAMRWATLQDRLALADISDERIPLGGTPGYAVFDLRAGYRFSDTSVFNILFENLTNEAYRYHGSSVNGPGLGMILNAEAGF